MSFLLLGSFGVALLILVAASVPISEPMVLRGDHLIWILWLVRAERNVVAMIEVVLRSAPIICRTKEADQLLSTPAMT